jgi:hypothetical protein
MERLRQIAGQLIEAIIATVVGPEDMQRWYPNAGKGSMEKGLFSCDHMGHVHLAHQTTDRAM